MLRKVGLSLVVIDLDLRNSQLSGAARRADGGREDSWRGNPAGCLALRKRPAAWQSQRLSLTAALTDLGIDQQLCHLDQLAS